jgi:3-dehydroquinate synthase
MKQIRLTFQNHSSDCRIIIGAGLVQRMPNFFDLHAYTRVLVITDTHIQKLHLPMLLSVLPKKVDVVALAPGEKTKTLEGVQTVLSAMHEAECDRHTLVITLGGGVISDMGGFAASIFMRGVDVLNIPTSLLSMVDAAIGGKTGVNFDGVKNLIGTIRQPIGVIIDVAFLSTLPLRDLRGGFAEIIKHGLIADSTLFEQATAKLPEQYTAHELTKIVISSCQVKTNIVIRDETEQNMRKLLNFGHTVGHAVEALSLATKKPLLHGEAITLGMIVESKISELVGLLSKNECEQIINRLKSHTDKESEIAIDATSIIQKIKSDKKRKGGHIQWTLLDRIGHAVINITVENDMVKKALHEIDI